MTLRAAAIEFLQRNPQGAVKEFVKFLDSAKIKYGSYDSAGCSLSSARSLLNLPRRGRGRPRNVESVDSVVGQIIHATRFIKTVNQFSDFINFAKSVGGIDKALELIEAARKIKES